MKTWTGHVVSGKVYWHSWDVDQAEEWMWQRMHIMRRMRLHDVHGNYMCYMWETVSIHKQTSCENTVSGCVECIIMTCLWNCEIKSLNMRSNSHGYFIFFDELLMIFWWSFDAVLKLHQNDAVLMQFHMESDAVLMQFQNCIKTASKLHQNCIKTASCFFDKFSHFFMKKVKISRPNDWLDIRI